MKELLARLKLRSENLLAVIVNVKSKLTVQLSEAQIVAARLPSLNELTRRYHWNGYAARVNAQSLRHQRVEADNKITKINSHIKLATAIDELTKIDIASLFHEELSLERQVKECIVNYLLLAYRVKYLINQAGLEQDILFDPFDIDQQNLSPLSSAVMQKAFSFFRSRADLDEGLFQFIQSQLTDNAFFNALLEIKKREMLARRTSDERLAYIVIEAQEFYDAVEKNNFLREMSLEYMRGRDLSVPIPSVLPRKERKLCIASFINYALFPVESVASSSAPQEREMPVELSGIAEQASQGSAPVLVTGPGVSSVPPSHLQFIGNQSAGAGVISAHQANEEIKRSGFGCWF